MLTTSWLNPTDPFIFFQEPQNQSIDVSEQHKFWRSTDIDVEKKMWKGRSVVGQVRNSAFKPREPDRPFHNYRAGDWRVLWNSELSLDGFSCSIVTKDSVGYFNGWYPEVVLLTVVLSNSSVTAVLFQKY